MNDNYQTRAFWKKNKKFNLRETMEAPNESPYKRFLEILADPKISFNDLWFDVGDMVVISPVCEIPPQLKMTEPIIYFIRNEEDYDKASKLVLTGLFETREPTNEEKELCYFWYENMNTPVTEISILKEYRNGKA
jgi:hypothetical protein